MRRQITEDSTDYGFENQTVEEIQQKKKEK